MDEARLAAWLGPEVRIEALSRMSGGAIQQNWALDVERGGAAERWVLRTDNPGTLAVSLPRGHEFALLRAAHAAGARAPEPLRLCEDASVIGAPFFLMRRAEGVAAAHALARRAREGGPDAALVEGFGAALARIHAIRPPRPDLAFLGDPPDDPCRAFVARLRARLDEAGTPRPVLEWGLECLERRAPPPAAPALAHNDFRTGNLMVEGSALSAALDWEFAGWDDPAADLGWLCAPCWRFGNRGPGFEAGGLGPRGALLRGYAAAGGAPPDAPRLAWWELAATLRWAVIAADQGGRFLSGAESSLELALTAHIIPELEIDVLDQVEALDAGATGGA